MLFWLARRLAGAYLVLVLVAAGTWLIPRWSRPERFGPISLDELRTYLERLFLHLNFDSPGGGRHVTEFVQERLPQDLQLLVVSGLLAILLGFAGGMFCARRPRALATRALETLAMVFLAAPVYVVGLLVILLFGKGFGTLVDLGPLMPAKYVPFSESPVEWLLAMIAPWVVLALPLAAFCLRMTNAVMLEVLDEQYIRTAAMKGVPTRAILRRHALPATASPVLSLSGVSIPLLVTNMVLIESVFSIPGVFQHMDDAIAHGDFESLQLMALIAGFLVVGASFVVDVALAAIDPRVRLNAPRSSS